VGTGVLTNLTWAATTRVFKAVTERIARSGPNVVAFVGTAAGMKPSDHCHLDVVVASRIHNPYAGKQVPSESGSKLLGRDKTYAVPVPLLAVVNACIAESEWTPSARSQRYNCHRARRRRRRGPPRPALRGSRRMGPLVDILCRGLLDSVEPEATSRIVAALVDRLDDETGSRVFAAYIQSVGK
jgi:hypothetical protein